MKKFRFLGFLAIFIPLCSFGAGGDFQSAAQLLTAARRGDIQTVQYLINMGADVNYVDASGMSLVCTAVMNNDGRAIQILQMYGADASQCDRQIKKQKQKTKLAQNGESFNFFSGLSSSHVLLLSAVGVAAVLGGVALLTDVFDADNNNSSSPSGGSHSPGGGGSGGSSSNVNKSFTVPYGPAYLTSDGNVNTSFDIKNNLTSWDTSTAGIVTSDFNYFRPNVATTDNFLEDKLPSTMQNYLLTMRGYYSLASGYLGQFTFRDKNNAPEQPKLNSENGDPLQGRPVRVALITGNGINPYGSADSANGIMYAINNTTDDMNMAVTDKYVNNTLNMSNMTEKLFTETEQTGFDLSGSGSAFNPYATKTESALAKIVAGWNGGRSSDDGDLTGFVPNAQLAIYRTGNGTVWEDIETATERPEIGTFTDTDDNGVLSATDIINVNGVDYTIYTAVSQVSETSSTLTINGTTYNLPVKPDNAESTKVMLSNLFIGKCGTDCEDIAIYVGTDGAWYVNSEGGDNIDSVYIADEGIIYGDKTKNTEAPYLNFTAIYKAVYSSVAKPDLIANVSVLPNSTDLNYLTVNSFTTMADISGISDSNNLKNFYNNQITAYYGGTEGGIANDLFYNNSALPIIIMPAGDKLYKDSTGQYYLDDLSATFENYAPMIYGNNLKHNFMTVVAVSHETGTSAASTITEYGDGTSNSYGPIVLSKWADSDGNIYSSRICGITGVGNSGSNIDPWCFAAAGPTAEMATASAAGAVASVKSAFSYMSNDQVFTLLALTADGPYLGSSDGTTRFSADTLKTYLQNMYELPLSYNESSLSSSEYLEAFKKVFGYGLINLERAIKPGYSVYYYTSGNIVSSSGNQFWGNVATSSTSTRASTIMSMTARKPITTSFFDVIESADGSLSLPRVWTNEIANSTNTKHGFYMGDVLADFNVNSDRNSETKIGNLTFNMSVSNRAYNDKFGGLDNLKIAFTNEKYELDAQYQHHLTNDMSRFDGRANDLLAISSNALVSGATYKIGNFNVSSHLFTGSVTDESLLDKDPVVSSQFEPARLGFVNGASIDTGYKNDKFAFNVSFGLMNENNTVLGMYSDGLFAMNGAKTTYVDTVVKYKPFENTSLYLRGTFADTHANSDGLMIADLSNIKSNSFAFGVDVGGLSLTASMPLAVVDGKMGYDYAEYDVVENNGKYEIAVNNAHTEYIDLSAQKREMRFAASYKKSVGEFTDAGVGFIYRVNPNNTDAFGNESVFMLKLNHRLGI